MRHRTVREQLPLVPAPFVHDHVRQLAAVKIDHPEGERRRDSCQKVMSGRQSAATRGGPIGAGETHVGMTRAVNQDALIIDNTHGLYAVLDGMGGANAGEVAAQTARDAIEEFVTEKRLSMDSKALLEAAIQSACQTVFDAGNASIQHQGMGTTVVACLVNAERAWIAHVGDSRAYLWRNGGLQLLTRDHTIADELVDRGLLSAEEAELHPYKNVLARNLGQKPTAGVDLIEVELEAGDRLLLCSDGLYGYAADEEVQSLLGSGDAPGEVARDLIELALRSGGGDNVSTIVIDVPPAVPTTTQVVRTSGAAAWWQHREQFLRIARERGLQNNPVCHGLEAVETVALSLCESVFHDLEKSTDIYVWTFAKNLAARWFGRKGDWRALRELFDILGACAHAVVDDIRTADAQLAFVLDIAVSRVLVVGDVALGRSLGEQLRRAEDELIHIYASLQDSVDSRDTDLTPTVPDTEPTAPFEGCQRSVSEADSTEPFKGRRRSVSDADSTAPFERRRRSVRDTEPTRYSRSAGVEA
jgi:protein phosphatase